MQIIYLSVIVHCHCSTPVVIHCRALLYRLPTLRAIEDHTLIQNKYHCNISYSVLFSVHCHRPSARATPMQGIVTPVTIYLFIYIFMHICVQYEAFSFQFY